MATIKAITGSRCSKRVVNRMGFFDTHQCERNATVEVDGMPFCTQHNPERVAQARAAHDAQYKAEWAQTQRKWDRQRAEQVLISEVLAHGLQSQQAADALEVLRGCQ